MTRCCKEHSYKNRGSPPYFTTATVLYHYLYINNLLPPGAGDGQVYISDTTAGVGSQFGVLYEPKKGSRVGVTYYSPIKLNFSTTPTFSNLRTIGSALQNNGLLNRNLIWA